MVRNQGMTLTSRNSEAPGVTFPRASQNIGLGLCGQAAADRLDISQHMRRYR
jgi:hypothetical protein